MAKRTSVYYLYGLTFPPGHTGSKSVLLDGIEGAPVKFLKTKGLSVVYSKVPSEDYSEASLESKLKNINWLEDRAREHYQVQAAVMNLTETMLPFKFCTLFKSKEKISKFITIRYESLENLLLRLMGKQEWSVKVFRNKEKLKMDVVRLSPQLKLAMEAQKDHGEGRKFLLAKKLLQDVDLAANEYYRQQTKFLVNDLQHVSEEWCQNENLSLAEKSGEDMVGNFAFLVKLNEIQNFTSKVNQFNDRQPPGSLYAHYTGPWLPYNFVGELGVDPCA
jgi:hypothetical protein